MPGVAAAVTKPSTPPRPIAPAQTAGGDGGGTILALAAAVVSLISTTVLLLGYLDML